jgi:hypothetical protein
MTHKLRSAQISLFHNFFFASWNLQTLILFAIDLKFLQFVGYIVVYNL